MLFLTPLHNKTFVQNVREVEQVTTQQTLILQFSFDVGVDYTSIRLIDYENTHH